MNRPFMPRPSRRDFLAASSAIALGTSLAAARTQPANQPAKQPANQPGTQPTTSPGDTHRGPVVIASGNGLRSVNRAMELMKQGYDPARIEVETRDLRLDLTFGIKREPSAFAEGSVRSCCKV